MAHVSSEIQGDSSQDEATGSASSITSPLCDHTLTGALDLRSVSTESAFQTFSARSLIRRPCHTFFVSGPDEDNDFRSMTFPRKLWKIVESDQFQSICWDGNGTCIVINEELFKKEVLERKAPFRVFETTSMKSFVRQLNLYGFSKVQQTFQRFASLADILADEEEASLLSKLHFYQNPNFKQGCPQLLLRMKRRVGIKNASPAASIAQNFNKEHSGTETIVGNHHSAFDADTHRESIVPASTNLNIPPISKPATSQTIANTATAARSEFSPPSSTLERPSEQTLMDKHAVLNQLTTFQLGATLKQVATGSYTQASGHIVNFITSTTSTSHYIISPLQRSYFGRMQLSTFPTRYPDLSVNDGPFSTLQPAGNPWFPMPMITDTSAATYSRSPRQAPPAGERTTLITGDVPMDYHTVQNNKH
ncbi:heat shock transcription factor, Y-linked-like [Pteropus medius]|uniref:heat shock transcription factor, Y-linked-like n=1 Tax=Pteropus vampyrus TaxID=132908 RepID=UPI00196AA3BA|nr:heat shock transcription factor, Y-linked-like [Pteropus giganteus]